MHIVLATSKLWTLSPDSRFHSQPPSLLSTSTWKSVKTASGNSAHLSHRHWHNEAKCFGIALLAWSESLGGRKRCFLQISGLFLPTSSLPSFRQDYWKQLLAGTPTSTSAYSFPHDSQEFYQDPYQSASPAPRSAQTPHGALLHSGKTRVLLMAWAGPTRQPLKFSGFCYSPCSFASDTFHLSLLRSSARRLCSGLLHGSSATFSMRSL